MTQDELMFFSGRPTALSVYASVRAAFLSRHPEAEVRVKKTQIGFAAPLLCVIAWLPRRKKDGDAMQLSLCLPFPLDGERVQLSAEPYPGRFMNHLLLRAPEDLDAELLGWMEAAARFAKR